MSFNLVAFLLVAGVSAAPTRHRQAKHHLGTTLFSNLEQGTYSGAPSCYPAWKAFDKARCWCWSGCALDCSQGGSAGSPGTELHPAWCNGQQESKKNCEPLIDNITSACLAYMDDKEKAPGLSDLCQTAGVGEVCVNAKCETCGAPFKTRVLGKTIKLYNVGAKAYLAMSGEQVSDKKSLAEGTAFDILKRLTTRTPDEYDDKIALYSHVDSRFVRMNPHASRMESTGVSAGPWDLPDDYTWEEFTMVETGTWTELNGVLYPEIALYSPLFKKYARVRGYGMKSEGNEYDLSNEVANADFITTVDWTWERFLAIGL